MNEDFSEQDHLPSAPHAEAAVLAALIENPDTYWPSAFESMLEADFFHVPAHRGFWEIMAGMRRAGISADPVSLTEAIRDARRPEMTVADLSNVMLAEWSAGGWDGYVHTLRDRLARRIAIQTGKSTADTNATGDQAALALRMASERANSVLSVSSAIRDGKASVKAFLAQLQAIADSGDMPGITTGIPQLDEMTGGLKPGEFWVIAGKTSQGKSALMLQIANGALQDNRNVLIFSLEMSVTEIISRLISCHGRIPISSVSDIRQATKGEVPQIRRHAEAFAESGIMICDKGTMTIDEIAGHAQRIADTKGVDLIVIDYIQLVHAIRVKGQNREQEVAAISRACKQLAKRIGCPVITASQLNEAGQTRESRSIEQDADALFQIVTGQDFTGLLAWKLRNGERNSKLHGSLDGTHQRFTFS